MAANEVFRRLQRRITLAERSYKDAFAELERLQSARASAAAAVPPAPEPVQPPADDPTELASSENNYRGLTSLLLDSVN